MTDSTENLRRHGKVEDAASQADEKVPEYGDEISKRTVDKPDYRKSGGDGHPRFNLSNGVISSLCTVDKMRIDQLVSELDKCMELRKETERQIVASKCENESMRKEFELCERQHGDEKSNLKLRLLTENGELNKLVTNTSRSLDILADQISAWERETALITGTLNELLNEKSQMEKEASRMAMRASLLAAEESRIMDTIKMNELQTRIRKIKSSMALLVDRGCQSRGTGVLS